jgi:hypothetical protein
MPKNMQAKHGNWIHLHQHPCISTPDNSRVAFCGAFFVSGPDQRKLAGRASEIEKGN